ncbi:hypothetical protein FIM10_02145 [Sphingomonadales bacterium 56]|uniref:hypothetical protein n=1 Tax=Sphingobium sp. S6 TaxID=2758386 RepID=UPI00191B1336|nr:hypothetical protein [Sphingobium sp. S6]MBY2927482.1 hypothetical protein [Sphingomonadales bacterium 56]CAD7335316.1 hypothetical protein SPHS6_00437 [Sphingobium sp. S6]
MIDTIATQIIRLNGKEYAKGDTVPMPLQQFEDLEPTGAFIRAPAAKARRKAKAAVGRSAPAPGLPSAATMPVEPSASKSVPVKAD